MARPTKLTQDLINTICAALQIGNYIDDACAAVNISRDTYYHWKRQAEEASRLLGAGEKLTQEQRLAIEFSDKSTLAIGQAAHMMLMRVHKAATEPTIERRTTRKVIGTRREQIATATDGTPLFEDQPVFATEETTIEKPPDVTNDRWRLERRFPAKFRTAQTVELSGPDGGPIPLEARASEASDRLRQLQQRRLTALPGGTAAEEPPADTPPATEGKTPA